MTQDYQNPREQTIIIKQIEKKTNGVGTAGLIIALIAVFLGWIPIYGWILWLIGLILSFVGIFKRPRRYAIAGLLFSFLSIVLLLLFFEAILGA